MAEFSVKNAALYRAGIGWFTAESEVDGDEIYFPVPSSSLDDFLKTSLINIKEGSASIKNLSFKTVGKGASLFSGSSVLMGILNFLRASEVKITYWEQSVAKAAEGKLLGYQEFKTESSLELKISLLTSNGILNIEGLTIDKIEPLLEKEKSRLDEFLASIASESDDEQQTLLRIQLTEKGKHEVQVSFLTAIPAWKLAYRLIQTGKESFLLETYGIVDNDTLVDWIDASLVLSTKTPVSYRYNLSTPHVIQRPEIKRAQSMGIAPPESAPTSGGRRERSRSINQYQSFMSNNEGMELAAEEPLMEQQSEIFAQYGQSIQEQASTELGESVEYKLNQPVTIRRKQSSMVPLSTTEFAGEEKLYFNSKNHSAHPFYIVEFVNSLDYAIEGGPITVYRSSPDHVGYKGEAMMSRVGIGDKYLLSYALNRNVSVSSKSKSRKFEERIYIDGLLRRIVSTNIRIQTYSLENKSDDASIIYLALSKQQLGSHYKPVTESMHGYSNKLEIDEASDEYRIITKLDGNSENELEFYFYLREDQGTYLYNLSIAQLEEILDNSKISDDEKHMVLAIYQVTKELDEIRGKKTEIQANYNRTKDRREQILGTLQVLDKESEETTRKKYINQIERIDEEITKFMKDLENLDRRLTELDRQRKDYDLLNDFIQENKIQYKKKK